MTWNGAPASGGFFRDRTSAYVRFRELRACRAIFSGKGKHEEQERLWNGQNFSDSFGGPNIPRADNGGSPPVWIGISSSISADIARIQELSVELAKAQSSSLITSFDDSRSDSHGTSEISREITRLLKRAEVSLARLK